MVQSDPDEKYKTELCKNWVQYGFCSYGDKCRFAHGQTDLVSKQMFNPKYKSKKCEGFHATCYCPYGGRCNFIHDDGTALKQRILYYTYLLDVKTKFSVIKYNLMKYLGEAFAAYASIGPYANQDRDALLEAFISYIKNGDYFKRLPVLVQSSLQEPELGECPEAEHKCVRRKLFVEDRLEEIFREIFGRFMQDFPYHKEEREYWDTLGLFLSVLMALHPDLKISDYFGLRDYEGMYIKTLEDLYDCLVAKPAAMQKESEEDEVIMDGVEDIIMNEDYYDDLETAADEEIGGLLYVFNTGWGQS